MLRGARPRHLAPPAAGAAMSRTPNLNPIPVPKEAAAATDRPPLIDGLVQSERTLLGHPKGLFLLFLVEMWERFSYYGMRGLLVLYLIAVFAARELPKGVYSNDLEMTQIQEVNGKPVDGASRHQQLTLAVSQPDFKPAGNQVTSTGA